VSEQPINSISNLDQRRYKADGSLEMGPETDVGLHMNQVVPNFDKQAVEAGREIFVKSPVKFESLSEVAVRGMKLASLNEIRVRHMRPEDTPFLQNEEDKAA